MRRDTLRMLVAFVLTVGLALVAPTRLACADLIDPDFEDDGQIGGPPVVIDEYVDDQALEEDLEDQRDAGVPALPLVALVAVGALGATAGIVRLSSRRRP